MCKFEFKSCCPHYSPGKNTPECKNCPFLRKYKKQTLIARVALVVVLCLYIVLTFKIFG